MSEAQPIETAPMPNEEGGDLDYLLLSTTGKVWFQGMWDDNFQIWRSFNSIFEDQFHKRFEPKFWAPLPSLPK